VSILPANHRYADREKRFLSALSLTWNVIAPDIGNISDRDAAEVLCDCYVEMYGRLDKSDLDAWHEFLRSPVKQDRRLTRALARSVI